MTGKENRGGSLGHTSFHTSAIEICLRYVYVSKQSVYSQADGKVTPEISFLKQPVDSVDSFGYIQYNDISQGS